MDLFFPNQPITQSTSHCSEAAWTDQTDSFLPNETNEINEMNEIDVFV